MFKTFIPYLMAFVFVLTTMSVAVAPPIATPTDDTALMESMMPPGAEVSVEDFLALTPRKIKEATGQKLTVKEAIALKVAQKKIKRAQKKAAKGQSDDDSGKSQLIALILVVLVGGLGIHRFYLGYTTIGIIQLLTLGGCGIWALIDLIRIITGDLGPADGSPYEETL